MTSGPGPRPQRSAVPETSDPTALLERAERRLRASHRVSLALDESIDLAEAAPRILAAVGECLGWDVGALWDAEAGVLRCLQTWRAPNAPGARFEELSRTFSFPPGTGLPGRVWSEGEPAWIDDVVVDTNFPRAPAAKAEGLHGACAFPLTSGGRVVGVAEFFSREIREPDEPLLHMFALVGRQVGQFVERRRAEAGLRKREKDLTDSSEQTRLILANALDAYVSMSAEGTILAWNPRAERTFGWSAQEVLGRRLADLIIPETHRRSHAVGLAHFLATGEGPILEEQIETTALRRGGLEFPVELAVTAVRVRDTWTFHAFIRDITNRRRIDVGLRASEKSSRRRAEAFRRLAVAAAAGGPGLAEELVGALAEGLGAREVVLVRVDPGEPRRGRSVARWTDKHRGAPLDFALEGTVCATVLSRGRTVFSRAAAGDEFPSDPLLAGRRAWISLAAPVRAVGGVPSGVLVALHDTPFEESFDPEGFIEAFAACAADSIESLPGS